ncbi:hypothetical protein SODALDRAFT_376841 [Sodiomyces alkalinus F11]|uniref:Uncharacterized protein n=1 Tax=Sodiomyces alkalinus (strain CBS 110278 / VKM F-3762 / F11) TaxID=1314773 RepID=A0A3N2Q313_SODAK|nr:hypothetical protein SODALDRAFT_376841 [Sodiomyces alkalinus F11]ROT41132.1 hypothetical protein SODALDRAFT_376841 [Sodiomyces alkalinus F11]
MATYISARAISIYIISRVLSRLSASKGEVVAETVEVPELEASLHRQVFSWFGDNCVLALRPFNIVLFGTGIWLQTMSIGWLVQLI